MKQYLAIIRNDMRLALRQKAVMFFNYLMPLGFFFIFAQSFHAEQGGAILQVVTMVTVIGILGNGLFGAGMRSVQDREANILRRYKVAPISPLPLLAAAMVTGLMLYLPYVALMLALAKYGYGMPTPPNLISVMLFITVGVAAICTRMPLSCMEFTTEAMMRPMERIAATPTVMKSITEIRFGGVGMP